MAVATAQGGGQKTSAPPIVLTKEHLAVIGGFAGTLELIVVHLGVRGAEIGPKTLGWFLGHLHSDLKAGSSEIQIALASKKRPLGRRGSIYYFVATH